MINCTFEDGNEAQLRHVVADCVVVQNDKILLVKRTKKLLEGGKWALVGGFVERDENVEEAARREILEETGYQVTSVTLARINSNPDRPHEDRQNISFIFFCEAGPKTGIPDWESDDQQWFTFDHLPAPDQLAFDHEAAIRLYQRFRDGKITLPLTS